ncbi:MAG: GH116 family glycosyl hydrolase [Pirellulaceae bacterium]
MDQHEQVTGLGRRDLHQVEMDAKERAGGCGEAGCCPPVTMQRRTFIQWAGLGAAALTAGARSATAGPFTAEDLIDHCVPVDKKLSADWLRALTDRGEPTWYRGTDLTTIGMPVGGIGAGQLYLTGDGRLAHWDIFNLKAPGYLYPPAPIAPVQVVDQGFAIHVRQGDQTQTRALDSNGFPEVSFRGQYPLATVKYEDGGSPVAVSLEAFSPFIPLNVEDSTLPATVMQYTVKNVSGQPLQGVLAGWLQNAVCLDSGGTLQGDLLNTKRSSDKATSIVCSASASERTVPERPVIVLADFEKGNYDNWRAEGQAFGTAPAAGTLPSQNTVDGFEGKGLVNTYLGGDAPLGKLISPPFEINRNLLSFLIGGGNHAGRTCINLLVDGQIVRTATGKAAEQLAWHNWNVRDLAGKQATIEIVDAETGPWGHINIDQIELTDRARTAHAGPLNEQPDFGTMSISVLAPPDVALASCILPAGDLPAVLFADSVLATAGDGPAPFGSHLRGAVGQSFQLDPGASTTIRFAVAWHFPNRAESGQYYAARFADATEVAQYVSTHIDRLAAETALWVRTYYDSSLPYWLLDRLHSTVSTLATSTCEIWKNGRFWAYEGVRCCHGTCGHVWNYEHVLARLFPQLERSVREMQDFNPEVGMVADTGMIRFRGNWPDFWCGDAQTGYILKAYREHQVSANDAFLTRNWPQIRKALEFLFQQDANDDGVIEGEQHNTYDINFYGPNPMIGILYLGALRAGEELAKESGDAPLAERCHKVYEAGRRYCTEKLFNGEYYIQLVDLQQHPQYQYANGCLSDQLFGQGWAHQVALDYILPRQDVQRALESIWKYNWAPDIAPQNQEHPPQRWFAYPGEAGLFTCTWPKSKHLGPESVLYRDEIWTGIEYQVAGHMAWEGMLTEALAICRAVHERYHPAKHNPWNEIECGDHYARGMASWGVLTGLAGFEYHGPKQHIGFAPRLHPQAFRSSYTAAEAWGSLDQQRSGDLQTNRIEVQWGQLPVQTLAFELPAGRQLRDCQVTAGTKQLMPTVAQKGTRVLITLAEPHCIACGESVVVQLHM